MKLTIKGQCDIGGSVNVRTEKHGDSNVGAMDISCSVLITRKQLNTLLREELAVQALFNEKAEGHFEPLFGGKIGPIALLGKFEKSKATFKLGLDEQEVTFDDCTIAKLKIDPQVGGMTVLKFTLQSTLDGHKLILDWAGSSQPFELRIGKLVEIAKENQTELPLGDGDPEDAGKADERLQAATDDPVTEADLPQFKGGKLKRVRPSRSKAAIAEREAAKSGEA